MSHPALTRSGLSRITPQVLNYVLERLAAGAPGAVSPAHRDRHGFGGEFGVQDGVLGPGDLNDIRTGRGGERLPVLYLRPGVIQSVCCRRGRDSCAGLVFEGDGEEGAGAFVDGVLDRHVWLLSESDAGRRGGDAPGRARS